MTEHEARQVLLLQARETGGPLPHWTAEDRAWATRQAVATVGEEAGAERFVVARAVVALQRLLPRDTAGGRRWLARRGWHAAWVWLALMLGFVAGLAADQLGPPQRVNLLAPAVWAVVAWNLAVYAALLLPLPSLGLRAALARWGAGGQKGDEAEGQGEGALWWHHAGPLLADRVALVLHTAAAALALGLVTGLYLRGLVLDYRAGWQSTFLDTAAVQQLLAVLLAPARWLTGITLPDVAPLRLAPDGDAQASAAPWIHLYAATLAMAVLLPRACLAALAGWRAGQRSQRFPLPLDTPYFEALHPLMRPGQPRAVRLLWLPGATPLTLLGTPVGVLEGPLTLLRSDEGDELALLPAPADLDTGPDLAPRSAAPPWWRPWQRTPQDPLPALRDQVAAVLWVAAPGAPRPPWLGTLGRPVIVVQDGPTNDVGDAGDATGHAGGAAPLARHTLADGWLADGRLLQALAAVLDDDPRFQRLRTAWVARQQARFDACVAELADTLARVACTREVVADEGLLPGRRAGTEAARQALLLRLDGELRAHAGRLAILLGLPAAAEGDVPDQGHAVPAAAAALRSRVGEGRAALVGGMVSGALAGLKADVLSGGLTMGAGAVAGGLLGALGAAGAARGLNVVRGTDRSHVAWNEEALLPVTETLLLRYLALAQGLAPEAARPRLAPALAAASGTLATLWRTRPQRGDMAAEAPALAQTLRRPLADVLLQTLGGPRADARWAA